MSKKLLLLVLWVAWLWNFSYRMMFTTIMPSLQMSMQLSNQDVGLLVGALSFGYGVISYPSSLASGKLDERWIICGGIALTTVSMLLFSISTSFSVLLILSFTAGAGLSTYLPQGVSLLSREYSAHHVGSVLGVHETAAPVGQTLGPLFVWSAIGVLGWSGCLQAWAIYSVVVCVLVLLLVPKSKSIARSAPKPTAKGHVSSVFFMMVIVQSAVWTCNLGLLSMVPVYLTKTFLLGVSYVAFILGVSRMAGAVGQLAGGYFSDKLGRVRILFLTTAMVFVATLWITLLPFDGVYVAGLFFHGIVSSAFFPVYFAMVSDMTDYSNRAKMIGLTNSVAAFVGGTVAPAVIGYLSDRFSFQTAFLFPIAMGIVGCIGALYVWKMRDSTRKMWAS